MREACVINVALNFLQRGLAAVIGVLPKTEKAPDARFNGKDSGSSGLGALPQEMITQDKGRHRFNHWNGPRQDARVVSPAGGEFSGFAGDRDCLLRPEDSRGRFEGHPKKDVLTIADSSLNPSGKIRPGA